MQASWLCLWLLSGLLPSKLKRLYSCLTDHMWLSPQGVLVRKKYGLSPLQVFQACWEVRSRPLACNTVCL